MSLNPTFDKLLGTVLQHDHNDLGSESFNGDRVIKRSGLPAINVGTTTTLKDYMEAFLFPFVPATLSLNSLSTYEVGTLQTPTLVGTLTLNDETVVNSRLILINSVESDTFTGTSINKTMPAITTNTTYQLKCNVGNNGTATDITSTLRSTSFIYPFFYGGNVASGLTGTSLYSGTTKLLATKSNKTVTLTGNDVYFYFAYPASYGDLTKIIDPNNFDVTSSFTKSTATVASTGLYNDWSLSYNIYQTGLTSASGSFQFQF